MHQLRINNVEVPIESTGSACMSLSVVNEQIPSYQAWHPTSLSAKKAVTQVPYHGRYGENGGNPNSRFMSAHPDEL